MSTSSAAVSAVPTAMMAAPTAISTCRLYSDSMSPKISSSIAGFAMSSSCRDTTCEPAVAFGVTVSTSVSNLLVM